GSGRTGAQQATGAAIRAAGFGGGGCGRFGATGRPRDRATGEAQQRLGGAVRWRLYRGGRGSVGAAPPMEITG
ncbi:hypothetical protein KI387_000125, partial [Taxus chinensis]